MANISENLFAWSNVGSSNQPDSGDAPTVQGDLQAIQAGVRGWLAHKGADIASATTTDIGAVEGLFHDITGTTTITGLGTVSAGIWKVLQFDGALTLTHNATSLIIPGGANITTAAGDVAVVTSEGSGNWRVVSYFRAAIGPFTDASDSVKGVIELAVQSEMETATDVVRAVVPGRVQYHPGVAKFWAAWATSGTSVAVSYNVTSVTNTGTGDETITIETDFSGADWVCVATAASAGGDSAQIVSLGAKAAGTQQLSITQSGDAGQNNTAADSSMLQVVGFGDQA